MQEKQRIATTPNTSTTS